MNMEKINRAISIIEKSRETHVEWAEWQENVPNWKKSIKSEDPAEHHRQCISEYDEVLNVLYSYYNEKNIKNYHDIKSKIVTDQGNEAMFCGNCGEQLEEGEFLIYCHKCHVYFTEKERVVLPI